MSHSDEADLIRRARRDRSAFALLYDRHVRRVYQFIYRRTSDEAVTQALTSATFEKALQHIGRFRWQSVGFGAWLYRIARNEVAQHYRRQKRSAPLLEWHVLDAGADSTARLWDAESGKLLVTFRASTAEVTAVAFSLWDAEGGHRLAQLRGHTGVMTRLAFLPDGRTLLSGSEGGTVRVWGPQIEPLRR